MNNSTVFHDDPHNFDLALNRLVDGELTGAAYRDFVGTLDDHPDGWRHCALAFLEEQALRRELGQELAEPIVAPAAAANPPRESRYGWLALAAAVLVAFTLGAVLRVGLGTPENPTNMPIATLPESEIPETETTPTSPPFQEQLVDSPYAVPDSPPTGPPPDVLLTADYNPALTLVVGEGEAEQRFRLPISEVETLEDDWYDQQQWAFTSQAQRELAEQGYQGTSRQSFVPIDLGDGRHMIVPVEEVMLQPVAYQ